MEILSDSAEPDVVNGRGTVAPLSQSFWGIVNEEIVLETLGSK